MTLIDADVFLQYLVFSKHIDSLKCKEVKEAIEMSKVDVFDKILEEIKDNTYFINETTEKEGIDFETVEKIIDKYRNEDVDYVR